MIRHSSLAFSVACGVLLFWAPLPFGSVGSGYRVLLWGLLVTVFLARLWMRDVGGSWLSVRTGVFCLLAIAALALMQSWSWPAGFARLVSPGHYRLAEVSRYSAQDSAEQSSQASTPVETLPAGQPRASADDSLREAGPASLGRVPLSFSRSSSRRAAMSWVMMAIALFSGALMASRRERRILLGALVCAAAFQVIYGGPRFFGAADLIWGQVVPAAEGRFRGTFVNPNHAAFFVGLVLPLVTAWLWLMSLRFRKGEFGPLGVLFVGLPAVVWLLLAGGIVLTQSRSGAVAMVVALVLQVVLFSKANRKMGVLTGGVVLAVLAGVYWWLLRSTGTGLGQRLWEVRVSGLAGETRGGVYQAVVSLWREFPLFGSGLGSFRSLFSARAPAEIRGQWWNAHSDWLELLVTGGVVSVILLLVVLTLVVRRSLQALSSVSRERRATGVAVVGSLMVAGLHSLVDFGLAMPANSLALAVIAGVGLAQSRSHRRVPAPGVDSGQVELPKFEGD